MIAFLRELLFPEPVSSEGLARRSTHRPPPPMPACKQPAVDNAALICEIKALREEIRRMRKQADPFARGGMVPDDLDLWPAGYGGYQPRPTSATPSPPPKKP